MSPTRHIQAPHAARDSRGERVRPQSIVTAVQVVAAWLIAFICVALMALIS